MTKSLHARTSVIVNDAGTDYALIVFKRTPSQTSEVHKRDHTVRSPRSTLVKLPFT